MIADERPQHRDLTELLRWAWYGSRADGETVKPSAISAWMGRDNRQRTDDTKKVRRGPPAIATAPRPKRQDASGQSGMIKAYLDRLRPLERNHLKAKYLLGTQRSRAREAVAKAVHRQIGAEWLKMPLVRVVVAEYYGKPTEDNEVLDNHQIGRHRLAVARRKVQITLDAVSAKAESAALDHFQNGGVLA